MEDSVSFSAHSAFQKTLLVVSCLNQVELGTLLANRRIVTMECCGTPALLRTPHPFPRAANDVLFATAFQTTRLLLIKQRVVLTESQKTGTKCICGKW